VEEAFTFSVYEGGVKHHDTPQQFWVSIERPEVTLKDVADSMVKKGGYWNEPELRSKYAAKVCSVLRLIAKSLRHLHSRGVIHGDLNLDSCGKFEHAWKLLGRIDVQAIGQPFDTSRFQQSFPPEALHSADQKSTVFDSDAPPVSFKDSIVANPSIDIWAFGKLAYEAITGKPLVEFEAKKPSDDVVALLDVMEWNESSMQDIFTELLESGGIAESGADLITSCLFPRPEDRPASMEAILSHRFWQENHRQRDKSKRSRRRRNTDSISAFTETSKSLFTEASD
jgi:serine/threonine protein kinase